MDSLMESEIKRLESALERTERVISADYKELLASVCDMLDEYRSGGSLQDAALVKRIALALRNILDYPNWQLVQTAIFGCSHFLCGERAALGKGALQEVMTSTGLTDAILDSTFNEKRELRFASAFLLEELLKTYGGELAERLNERVVRPFEEDPANWRRAEGLAMALGYLCLGTQDDNELVSHATLLLDLTKYSEAAEYAGYVRLEAAKSLARVIMRSSRFAPITATGEGKMLWDLVVSGATALLGDENLNVRKSGASCYAALVKRPELEDQQRFSLINDLIGALNGRRGEWEFVQGCFTVLEAVFADPEVIRVLDLAGDVTPLLANLGSFLDFNQYKDDTLPLTVTSHGSSSASYAIATLIASLSGRNSGTEGIKSGDENDVVADMEKLNIAGNANQANAEQVEGHLQKILYPALRNFLASDAPLLFDTSATICLRLHRDGILSKASALEFTSLSFKNVFHPSYPIQLSSRVFLEDIISSYTSSEVFSDAVVVSLFKSLSIGSPDVTESALKALRDLFENRMTNVDRDLSANVFQLISVYLTRISDEEDNLALALGVLASLLNRVKAQMDQSQDPGEEEKSQVESSLVEFLVQNASPLLRALFYSCDPEEEAIRVYTFEVAVALCDLLVALGADLGPDLIGFILFPTLVYAHHTGAEASQASAIRAMFRIGQVLLADASVAVESFFAGYSLRYHPLDDSGDDDEIPLAASAAFEAFAKFLCLSHRGVVGNPSLEKLLNAAIEGAVCDVSSEEEAVQAHFLSAAYFLAKEVKSADFVPKLDANHMIRLRFMLTAKPDDDFEEEDQSELVLDESCTKRYYWLRAILVSEIFRLLPSTADAEMRAAITLSEAVLAKRMEGSCDFGGISTFMVAFGALTSSVSEVTANLIEFKREFPAIDNAEHVLLSVTGVTYAQFSSDFKERCLLGELHRLWELEEISLLDFLSEARKNPLPPGTIDLLSAFVYYVLLLKGQKEPHLDASPEALVELCALSRVLCSSGVSEGSAFALLLSCGDLLSRQKWLTPELLSIVEELAGLQELQELLTTSTRALSALLGVLLLTLAKEERADDSLSLEEDEELLETKLLTNVSRVIDDEDMEAEAKVMLIGALMAVSSASSRLKGTTRGRGRREALPCSKQQGEDSSKMNEGFVQEKSKIRS